MRGPELLHSALIWLAFLISGAVALAFEALFFHQTALVLGNSVWASSLVLAGFMAGMALGNHLAARHGDRIVKPLRAYAVAELLVAVCGAALIIGLPLLGPAMASLSQQLAAMSWLLQPLRLLSAFALLLIPSTAMGTTLPLLARSLSRVDPNFGRSLGLLYAVNTLGAVGGVLLTETLLLERLGVIGSALSCAALGAVAATLAWALSAGAPVIAAEAPSGAREGRILVAAAALAGFAMLALEVVWLRFLVLFLNDTPLAFAIILALVLTGLAIGALIGALWLGRDRRAHRHASLASYLGGAGGVLGLLIYPETLQRYLRFDQEASTVAGVAAPLVLPAAIASGLLFTLLAAALKDARRGAAEAAGTLSLANTLGAALGAALAGLWLLPTLGMEKSLFLCFALYGVGGAAIAFGSRRAQPAASSDAPSGEGAIRFGLLAGFVGILALFPFGAVRDTYIRGSIGRWMTPHDRVVAIREGLTATHIHVRHGLHGLELFDQLASNAYSMSVNDYAARRYMKLYAYLPLALHPGMERALVLGYGVGNTAKALTDTREFKAIDVVDISSAVFELARGMDLGDGSHPLDDRRLTVHLEDGRHFLAGTHERYDLITGEPPPPIMAGVGSLYSREYFRLMRSRLAEGGFATYWLPMMNLSADGARSIIAAFCDAFDDCSLWHGSGRNFMLVGAKEPKGPVSLSRYMVQWASPQVREELLRLGFEHPAQLGALFIGGADYLQELTARSEPLSDDWPKRLLRPMDTQTRDDLMWSWRDTGAARKRFIDSTLTTALFPPVVKKDAELHFENQRLLNDLLFPGKSPARRTHVLDQVLFNTPLKLPVLLLVGSDPDVTRALSRATPQQLRDAKLLPHLAAARLVERDTGRALSILRRVDPQQIPLEGLREYLEQKLVGGAPPGPLAPKAP